MAHDINQQGENCKMNLQTVYHDEPLVWLYTAYSVEVEFNAPDKKGYKG